jgi:hypothetical protein
MLHAIHVHPHDIRDEGAEQVVRNIVELAKIKTIIAEAVTLEERHPYPSGVLPHNPRHSVVISKATLEVPLEKSLFGGLPVHPVVSGPVLAGDDYIADLNTAALKQDATVVPWIKGLNGAFFGKTDQICVRTLDGELVPTWLCPSHTETLEYVTSLIYGILERYHSQAILLDRMRYPDWSGETVKPERMLTCFCPTCKENMKQEGIDLPVLERGLRRILEDGRNNPDQLNNIKNFNAETIEIKKWLLFRNHLITRLVEHINMRLQLWNQKQGSQVKFWLNLWPPSFAWLLGQDYQALGKLCDGAKHFPYHRLGGGADLKGLVETLAGEGNQDLQAKIFQLIMGLIQLPYHLTFEEFKNLGLPVDFVGRETVAGKEAFGPEKLIFSGIQIWNTPKIEIVKACQAARDGNADGLFFYCYGWADLPALKTVGQIVAGNIRPMTL